MTIFQNWEFGAENWYKSTLLNYEKRPSWIFSIFSMRFPSFCILDFAQIISHQILVRKINKSLSSWRIINGIPCPLSPLFSGGAKQGGEFLQTSVFSQIQLIHIMPSIQIIIVPRRRRRNFCSGVKMSSVEHTSLY